MLEIKTSYHGGILNIELFGALDSLTSPDFKLWLNDKASGGYHYFALNCSGLEFISSRGISVLIELNNILNENDTRLILYQISNEVENLLDFLKLSSTIPVAESFNQVLEKFGSNPSKTPGPDFKAPIEIAGKKQVEGIAKNAEESKSETSDNRDLNSDKKDDERYINLSKEKHGNDISIINIIFCPNCGEKLKVSKKGLYLCPECRNKFNYPFN